MVVSAVSMMNNNNGRNDNDDDGTITMNDGNNAMMMSNNGNDGTQVADVKQEATATATATATAAAHSTTTAASSLSSFPSLMDRDNDDDGDGDNEEAAPSPSLPLPKEEEEDNNNGLYIDVNDDNNDNNDAHNNNNTPSTTPTVVEIIDESGCDNGGGSASGAGAGAGGSSSSSSAAAAAAAANSNSPFLLNKLSSWRTRNQQQPQQQQPQQTTTAATAATATATVTAFWNKHKSPSFEHGLKRIVTEVVTAGVGVVAATTTGGGLTTTTSTTASTASLAPTTTAVISTTKTGGGAQPLESAKLESPLATTPAVTAVTAAAAAAAAVTPSGIPARAENQETAATTARLEEKEQEHNVNSEQDQHDDNDERERGGNGGASTDGGGIGSRYSRSRSWGDNSDDGEGASNDSGGSYWSGTSTSSSSDDDDGSKSSRAAVPRARGTGTDGGTASNNNTTNAAAPAAGGGVASLNLRGTLKWAAVNAVDSMQQSYRGRYTNNNNNSFNNNNTNNNRTTTSTTTASAMAVAAALVSGGGGARTATTRGPFPLSNNNNNISQGDEQVNNAAASTLSTDPTTATTTANNNTVSHTHRLLHSRAHDHVAQLMKHVLQSPHEYLLLLGQGMLGVNLKPTYLARRGVYVDFLVHSGAAQDSRVVYPGDLLCQIGDSLNVRNGGILEIPAQLAATKRPVHLVLSSGTDYYHHSHDHHHHHAHDHHHHVDEKNKNRRHYDYNVVDKTCYINHVDLCAAMLHVILNPTNDEDETKQTVLLLSPDVLPNDDNVVPSQQEQDDENSDDADRQQQQQLQDVNDADKQQQPKDEQQQPQPSFDCSKSDDSRNSNGANDQDDAAESRPAVKGPGEETDSSNATPAASTTNMVSPENGNTDSQTTTPPTTTTATDNNKKEEDSFNVIIPNTIHQVEDLLHAQIPTKAVRNGLGRQSARRANHLQPRHVEEIWTMTMTTTTSGSSTLAAISNNDWNNLQMALKHAFILTVLDGRRFPFLTRFWTLQQPALSQQPNSAAPTTTMTAATPPPPMHAIMMTLFLEMHTYCDLYGITPVDKLRLSVRSVAYKFFLPTSLGNNELVPPLFDYHHIVPDSSLRQLEQVLKQMNKNSTNDNNNESSSSSSSSCCPPRNVFWDFQQAVLEILAGKAFLSFIITDECARMRAFLRETAPYLHVPLDRVWQHLVQSRRGGCGDDNDDDLVTKNSEEDAKNAKNYFLYVLVYLLCQMDHEPFGEHGELPAANSGNENANSNNNISNTTKKYNRMEEATSGICAALFIQSRLLPSIQAVRHQTMNANQDNDDNHDNNLATLVSDYEQLWEIYLSPVVGVLHRALQSQETKAGLGIVLDRLTDIQTFAQHERNAKTNADNDGGGANIISSDLVNKLVDVKLVRDLNSLAQELVYYEYALVYHSKFRAHKFHEWMCTEAAKVFATLDEPDTSGIPALPVHCIKRLLRKAEFPQGVSSHKPAHHVISTPTSDTKEAATAAGQQGEDDVCNDSFIGAECAVVFGTNIGINVAASGEEERPTPGQTDIRRYTCQSLQRRPKEEENVHAAGSSNSLKPEEVPQMVESYAIVPPSRTLAFADYAKDSWKSRDGWEVSLVNFMLPRAGAAQDGSDAPIYGVSLVLSRQPAMSDDVALDEEHCIPTEFVEWSSSADDETTENFTSPISFSAPSSTTRMMTPIRRVRLSKQNPNFSAQLSERSWRDQVSLEQQGASANSTVTVGIALVSQRNVLISMRDTLSRLVQDFSRPPDGDVQQQGNCLYSCAALVDVLGNCANPNIEPESLLCILEPYLRLATKPWIERPIGDQERVFKRMAGEQLVKSLPPIPLALLFVTVLLEQKVVFSSSRRSLLLSATTALAELLKPLKWCHLIVPRVPCALAGDLLQYPAPFILGMPSDDPGVLDLIQDLPDDITLVDLDVGRVILAPTFAHNADIRKESTLADDVTTARAIRSQVLYLAQSLGAVFGSCMDPVTWSCDRWSAPLTTDVNADEQQQVGSASTPFDRLKAVCHDFLQELLAGTTSCCYWVEEVTSSTSPTSTIEPTVLFDEDRFFRLKNQRFQKQQQGQQHGNHQATATSFHPLLRPPQDSTRLALSCDGWWLVMEILLRCQNMNDYIGTRDAKEMMFSL